MRGPGEGGEARSDPRAAVAGAVPALLPPAAAPSCGPALPAPRGPCGAPFGAVDPSSSRREGTGGSAGAGRVLLCACLDL